MVTLSRQYCRMPSSASCTSNCSCLCGSFFYIVLSAFSVRIKSSIRCWALRVHLLRDSIPMAHPGLRFTREYKCMCSWVALCSKMFNVYEKRKVKDLWCCNIWLHNTHKLMRRDRVYQNCFYILFCGMEISTEGNWGCFWVLQYSE